MDSLSSGNAGILGSFQNGRVTQQLFVLTANYAITLTHKAAVWPTTEATEVCVFVCLCVCQTTVTASAAISVQW